MISVDNRPVHAVPRNEDFTVEAYRDLLRLCLSSYSPASYGCIPWGERFVLWRHDCDYSLNRALAVGRAEHEEGLRSTFFVNLHSEFYNLLERGQIEILNRLLAFGHDVGLHFDAAFHSTRSEEELHDQVDREAGLLEHFLGRRPAAFSFHNPTAFHLSCESDRYGGLVNCYSRRFKTEVPYCSDSNGYWRFRRLAEVLNDASDPCLQILTHPGWWQSRAMPPRQRVFRCAFGRARATMRLYDDALEQWDRENFAGTATSIRFLRSIDFKTFETLDYLWNGRRFASLFLELSRLHETQLWRICEAILGRQWRLPAAEVSALLDHVGVELDVLRVFESVGGKSWLQAEPEDDEMRRKWSMVRYRLAHGLPAPADDALEAGCVELCRRVESLAAWGRRESIGFDGLGLREAVSAPSDVTPTRHSGEDRAAHDGGEPAATARGSLEDLRTYLEGFISGEALGERTSSQGPRRQRRP
ncbi:hypothetical protein [Accumulibacter sp.]|uniref:hypothetical protein n=1 Tax=Accumulibacter sp. TaxID=2053492 RepID=UPI0025DA2D6A|nr:hypothetical protein [Accumulibacter sp.]MCM8612110.1 hypothetical protein [Accumulibacter sp.]MCM8635776.1 hypothetical protein [Accumulibacter sp.]MCM8639587.1 hypothetical protein [Accumulibacter sp.]